MRSDPNLGGQRSELSSFLVCTRWLPFALSKRKVLLRLWYRKLLPRQRMPPPEFRVQSHRMKARSGSPGPRRMLLCRVCLVCGSVGIRRTWAITPSARRLPAVSIAWSNVTKRMSSAPFLKAAAR